MPKLITLHKRCVGCGMEASLAVPEENYERWQRGARLSETFWFLTDSEREFFFLSHLCDPCWDEWTL